MSDGRLPSSTIWLNSAQRMIGSQLYVAVCSVREAADLAAPGYR